MSKQYLLMVDEEFKELINRLFPCVGLLEVQGFKADQMDAHVHLISPLEDLERGDGD